MSLEETLYDLYDKAYRNGYKYAVMYAIKEIKSEINEYLQAEGFGSEYRNDIMHIIDRHAGR